MSGSVKVSLIQLALCGRCLAAAGVAGGLAAGAQERRTAGPPLPPALKQIAPGLFEIGAVRLDQERHAVRFPATVNMKDGAIEYLLVTKNGKTHESLLRTDAEPQHIHLAMLLLGAKGAGTNAFLEDLTKPLPGDRVSLEIQCLTDGKEKRFRAEDLVFNTQTQAVMTRGGWVYNGSRLVEGTFLAQRDGSIVSLMTDEDALINNPRLGRENDKIWQPNAGRLPPVNTPVEVILTLEAPAGKP